MTARLAGRTAIVAGASKGIGLAIVRRFASEGAQVFALARSGQALDAAVAGMGDRVVGIEADMTDVDAIDRAYAHIGRVAPRIDILVANVGGAELAPLGRITPAHFDRVVNQNMRSTLFTVQQALPLLAQGASVILVSSSSASRGTPALSVYSAAKAAVRSFARSWMVDLRVRGIRVNVLSPGPTDTPGLQAMAAPGQASRMLSGFASRIPSGRVGATADVAAAALFLASEESAFVNGTELAVDGGFAQI